MTEVASAAPGVGGALPDVEERAQEELIRDSWTPCFVVRMPRSSSEKYG